jgi:hypothetical protein
VVSFVITVGTVRRLKPRYGEVAAVLDKRYLAVDGENVVASFAASYRCGNLLLRRSLAAGGRKSASVRLDTFGLKYLPVPTSEVETQRSGVSWRRMFDHSVERPSVRLSLQDGEFLIRDYHLWGL